MRDWTLYAALIVVGGIAGRWVGGFVVIAARTLAARHAARTAPNAPVDDLGAHAAPVVYGPRHQTFIANYVASLTRQGHDAEAARREAQQIVTEHLDYPGFP